MGGARAVELDTGTFLIIFLQTSLGLYSERKKILHLNGSSQQQVVCVCVSLSVKSHFVIKPLPDIENS